MSKSKYSVENYRKEGQQLYDKLRMLTFPLAIK